MQGLDSSCPCSGAMKRLIRSSSHPLEEESPPRNKKILIESPSSSSMKDPTINTPANIHYSDQQLQSNPSLQVSPSICTSNSVPFTSSENNESNISNVNSLASNSPVSCFNSKSSQLPFKRPLPFKRRCNSVPFTSSENNESNINNVNSLASNSPVSCFNSKSSLPFKRPLPFKRQCSNSVPLATLKNNEININNVNSLASKSPASSCFNSKSSLPFKRQRNSVPLTTSESSSEINNNVNSFLSPTEIAEHHNPPHPQHPQHSHPHPPPFHPPPPDSPPPPYHHLPPLPDDAPPPPAVWRICCIGATRIGTVTMMMIANFCPNVDITIVDDDLNVIHGAMQGEFPFHEPHLELLSNHLIGLNPPRLRFTPDKEASILNAHMIFIAIGIKSKTKPRAKKGQVDCSEWMNVWIYLVSMQNIHAKIIVDLTTLPLDFEDLFRCAIGRDLNTYRVVLNPSFIEEGRAINDIHNPSIVVLATRDLEAAHALRNLYHQWVPLESIYAIPNLQSAVLAKLGLNSILASRVVSIKTLNYIAELWGAERNQILHIISEDYRIEEEYLHRGVDFGGPDLEKCLYFLSEAASQKGLVDESRFFKQLVKGMNRKGNVLQRIWEGLRR